MRKVYLLLIVLIAAVSLVAAPLAAQDVVHVVQPGENLFRIAQIYGTDVNTLVQLNGITNSWQIYAGQVLVIPGAASPIQEPVVAALELPAVTQTHVVTYGEHLSSIANAYGMSPEQLAALNGITNPNLIYVGQVLTVNAGAPAPAAEVITVAVPTAVTLQNAFDIPQPAATGEVRHIVQPGQYLSQIASQYGVSWLSIAQANGIYDPNTIYAGLSLVIPGATSGTGYIVEVPPAPPAYIGSGREIIVDLSDQRTYAYENGILIRNVLVSTGLPATPTVQGDFVVERKYGAQTMAGPGYYLPDVPYVMYFYSGYALHGTYWHSNFGQPMSHGCVNLPTPDAEWFYNWADYGTPVHVQA
jgi:LysM repeat protein